MRKEGTHRSGFEIAGFFTKLTSIGRSACQPGQSLSLPLLREYSSQLLAFNVASRCPDLSSTLIDGANSLLFGEPVLGLLVFSPSLQSILERGGSCPLRKSQRKPGKPARSRIRRSPDASDERAPFSWHERARGFETIDSKEADYCVGPPGFLNQYLMAQPSGVGRVISGSFFDPKCGQLSRPPKNRACR